MGEKNSVTKEYMKQNDRFADVCNYYLFHGNQVIKAKDLEERDITELVVPYKESNTAGIERLRDILKNCVVKTAKGITYLIIGIENQSEIHYAMPVRNMLYDAMRYDEQVKKIAAKHKKNRELHSNAEYLSGLNKNDRLKAIVTLTIYWNTGKWDGARSLHELIEVEDPDILDYVPDYRLNLIVPDEINNFDKFQTEFGTLMQLFSKADSGDELDKYINSGEDLVISNEAVRVINTCLDMDLKMPEKKEETMMCKGMQELLERSETKGKTAGKIEAFIELVKDGLLDISVAAERANISVEEFEKLLANNG